MQTILAALDETMSVGGAVSGKVRLVAPNRDSLELLASRGLSDDFQRNFSRVSRADRAPSALASTTGARVVIANVKWDPRAALYEVAAGQEGFSAMQASPIVDGNGKVIGTLSTHFAAPPRLSTAEYVLLDHFAAKLAMTLAAWAAKLQRPLLQ